MFASGKRSCAVCQAVGNMLLGRFSKLAQQARCASERGAQRSWGPLGTVKMLRASLMRATRVLRAGRES